MVRIVIVSAAVAACGLSACEDRSANPGAAAPSNAGARQPDNTGVNTRDRNDATKTPPDQAEGSEADRNITAEVRRAITSDSGMSVNARNVKIITNGGVVTLRGPVDTQAEKDAIEAKAKGVSGVTTIDDQLEVKTH